MACMTLRPRPLLLPVTYRPGPSCDQTLQCPIPSLALCAPGLSFSMNTGIYGVPHGYPSCLGSVVLAAS
jgi:hypothetical protein